MQEPHFTEKYAIRIFYFFARFVREVKIQGMSEAQAFIALPEFLTGLTRFQYETGFSVTTSQSG